MEPTLLLRLPAAIDSTVRPTRLIISGCGA